jgi:hypothetical protein
MTANPYEFRMHGRPTVREREAVGHLRIAELQAAATSDASLLEDGHRSDLDVPRGSGPGSLFLTTDRWTAAHTEAARFLGECVAVGALLGLVVEMARPRKGERHG